MVEYYKIQVLSNLFNHLNLFLYVMDELDIEKLNDIQLYLI
jgi:hypothetical protein